MQPVAAIMVTDEGPHPAETWAEVTADQIIRISESAPEGLISEARVFRERLVLILTGHHDRVQQHERGQIAEAGHARLQHDLDAAGHIDGPLAEIIEAAGATSFADHFQKLEIQQYLRDLLHSHFATSMFIERSWHADRNPETSEAQAFRAVHQPIVV